MIAVDGQARRLPAQARSRADAGAVRRRRIERRAGLRDPAPRRPEAPLRPSARARRRACKLGGAEGPATRGGRTASGGARRGPSARLRLVRGRDPRRPVRRGNGGDLGPWDVRAARGEAERRADRPPARRARRRGLDARPGPAGRRRAQLAPAPQGRGRGRRVAGAPSAARDADRAPAERCRLALRAKVGWLPRHRHAPRRRRHADEPERQGPHRALPRRCPRGRARGAHALGRARRRGLRARRVRHRSLRVAAVGRRAARPDGLRPARAGRGAGVPAPARGAEEAARGRRSTRRRTSCACPPPSRTGRRC